MMQVKQGDLNLTTYVGHDPTNSTPPLLSLVERLQTDRLLIPPFQRDYIWPTTKAREWIHSVMSKKAIGVFVTYQIRYDNDIFGPCFLADGYQRLTSTRLFIEHPQKYGFDFGPKQAKEECAAYIITVQHRHYKSHDEAMEAFQNLNKGTITTPAEFHKGELTLDPLGQELYDCVPSIVDKIVSPYLGSKTQSRSATSKLLRDCFGLFYQYISSAKVKQFWSVGKVQGHGLSIESRLLGYARQESWTPNDMSKKLKDFESFLANTMKTIEGIVLSTGQTNKRFSPTFLRWLFHLSIWRKNNGRPVQLYLDFLERLFIHQKQYRTFTTRMAFGETPAVTFITLNADKLTNLARLCGHFDVPLYQRQSARKGSTAVKGCDVSHVKPFSIHGEGETIIEPSSINRARGANPIEGQCPLFDC